MQPFVLSEQQLSVVEREESQHQHGAKQTEDEARHYGDRYDLDAARFLDDR